MESALGVSLMQYAIVDNDDGSVSGPNGRYKRQVWDYGNTKQFGGNTLHIVDSVFNTNGRLIYTADDYIGISEGSYDKEQTLYEELQVTKGKYNLIRKTRTENKVKSSYSSSSRNLDRPTSALKEYVAGTNKSEFNGMKKYGKTVSDKYYLNGEEVKAKAIGGGRYEVIKQDGTVLYISHDGYNLKPDYVASNPKKVKKQKLTMGLD